MPARKLRSKQRDNPGDQKNSFGGRVISVKLGNKTRRIGIDGSADNIIKTIKSAFGLRTRRAFWLEDADNIARIVDRDMHVGMYTLHLDEGLKIKVRDGPEQPQYSYVPPTENKIFYTEDDFHDLLSRRGWICLRENKGSRKIHLMDELTSGRIYYGSKN